MMTLIWLKTIPNLVIANYFRISPLKIIRRVRSKSMAYSKMLSLGKENTSYDDLLDALRLSLEGYDMK